jgi:CBS domain-containing protein
MSKQVTITMTITGTVGDLLRLKPANLWTIEPEKTVFEGIKLMAQKNIGAVPVVSGGRLIGMLSERDYTRKVALLGRSSKETTIGQILTTPVTTATTATTIVEGLRMMTEKRVRHLPVLDGETLLGIVSIGDLVNFVINAQQDTIHQLHNYISGQYPG